jgi:flagellar hook-associated protein 1 FlgK
MTGTFSSFGSALSALRYSQTAMDVAGLNLSNADSKGYTRQRVEASASTSAPNAAMYARGNSYGDGVAIDGISRAVDLLLNARARTEHATQSYLDVQAEVLKRVEAGVNEPGTTGINSALDNFRKAWSDLVNSPDQSAARSQVLASSSTLAEAIRSQAAMLAGEDKDARLRVLDGVDKLNTIASEMASLNEKIQVASFDGTVNNTMLDRRDQLMLELSQVAGTEATIQANGTVQVTLGGLNLVSGNTAATLSVSAGINPDGTGTGAPIGFELSVGGTVVGSPTIATGTLGGLTRSVDTTLKALRDDLDTIATTFADTVNGRQAGAFDQDGNAGEAMFSYTAGNAAATLTVTLTDPRKVAASSVGGGVLNTDNARWLGNNKTVEGSYQTWVAGLGSSVVAATRVAANQKALTSQVDGAIEQLGGVSIDEEMVNLVSAQRIYEAAARVITTLDSVLDTLINRTGVTR